MEEPILHAESWFRIKGRGFVAAIREQYPDTDYDPDNYANKIVKIDGERFMCAGAETFKIARSIEYPYRFKFCLLVKEIEATPDSKPVKKPKKAATVEGDDWIATFPDG